MKYVVAVASAPFIFYALWAKKECKPVSDRVPVTDEAIDAALERYFSKKLGV